LGIAPPFIMKVIIFNDTQNFNGSLNFINNRFGKNEKRFWNYKKYIPFLMKKIKSIDNLNKEEFQLIKTYFYEGRYNSKLIGSHRWNCNKKIAELNQMIGKEQTLLDFISQEKLSRQCRRKVNVHINKNKEEFERKKQKYFSYIAKQKRNFEGQKELFAELESNSFIELKCTPLKQSEGEVYQKGVDVLMATDLVNLAHTDAYDVAIILSGDTDLVEAVKLIESLGKTAIIFSYHTPGKPELSNISDLMTAGKFINLKDLTDEEIFEMSELRKEK
jgi:uncharacterized LabA/DUF88 family protein